MTTNANDFRNHSEYDNQIEAMMAADAAGKAWAQGLAIGQLFLGAGPAAQALFARSTPCYRLFVSAALDELECMTVEVNTDGYITWLATRFSLDGTTSDFDNACE